MKKLRTRFSLALSVVLLAATVLPILVLYLLSMSGLIEAAYVAKTHSQGQDGRSLVDFPIPRTGGGEGERLLPGRVFDPKSGTLNARLGVDLPRVIFTSPVFQFRVDVPAWFAIGALLAISLLIGLLLSIWMSHGITRPVSQLAEAAQAIGRRDLSCRVEAKGSQELQDLAQSFNRMAEALERAEMARCNLMADVAHELRTPLAVLKGNLRAILDGVHELNEDEIALLYEQTHHLNRLVDDLGELSLAEADQLPLNCGTVELGQLIRETFVHLEPVARGQGIRLSLQLSGDLIHPSLDDHRIRQVLHNLLSNALRHTPNGGAVTISAIQTDEGNAMEISVADTGEGISPEELVHIFDRFHRAEGTHSRSRSGTGLGLAIVKAIVEAHGGRVRARSIGKNRGSTFTVELPLRRFTN